MQIRYGYAIEITCEQDLPLITLPARLVVAGDQRRLIGARPPTGGRGRGLPGGGAPSRFLRTPRDLLVR